MINTHYISYMTLSAMLLLTGCAAEMEEGADVTLNQAIAEAESMVSGIEINFEPVVGTDGTTVLTKELTSRASIDDIKDMTKDQPFGVYCLAVDKLTSTTPDDYINWITKSYCAPMKNIVAIPFSDSSTKLKWDEVFYYPCGNLHKFAIYSYYPYIDNGNSNLSKGSREIVATYNIDGSQDIIWGKSTMSSGDDYKYSAKYFTLHPNEVPQVEFKHTLVRLIVKAKVERDPGISEGEFNQYIYRVLSFKIRENRKVRLTIANVDDNSKEGKLSEDLENPVLYDFEPLDADANTLSFRVENSRIDGIDPASSIKEVTLGEIMLPARASYQTTASLRYDKKNGQDSKPYTDIQKTLSLPSGEFEAGHSYTVVLKITGKEPISVTEIE